MHGKNSCGTVVVQNRIEQILHLLRSGKTEKGKRLPLGNFPILRIAPEKGNQLVKQRLGIAHAAVRRTRDDIDGRRGNPDLLLLCDIGKAFRDQVGGNPAQIKPLAARNHGRKHLVHFRRRENEFRMGGRLFNRLEQCVPCAFREHVHFVNNIDFIFGGDRKMEHVLADLPCLVHLCVGRGVDFNDVHIGFIRDGLAGGAFTAGFTVNGMFAVERFCKNSRRCGFSDSARSHEKVGMRNPSGPHGILQRSCNMLLTDHVGKPLRTPLSGCYLICHIRSP